MRIALAFVLALLVATACASVVQTQVNLASLSALGVDVSVGTRLAATGHDLFFFAPLFALLVAPVLATGFALARLPALAWPQSLTALRILMPALLMFALLAVISAVPAVPAVISAARGMTGMVLISLAMAVGGWIRVWCGGKTR